MPLGGRPAAEMQFMLKCLDGKANMSIRPRADVSISVLRRLVKSLQKHSTGKRVCEMRAEVDRIRVAFGTGRGLEQLLSRARGAPAPAAAAMRGRFLLSFGGMPASGLPAGGATPAADATPIRETRGGCQSGKFAGAALQATPPRVDGHRRRVQPQTTSPGAANTQPPKTTPHGRRAREEPVAAKAGGRQMEQGRQVRLRAEQAAVVLSVFDDVAESGLAVAPDVGKEMRDDLDKWLLRWRSWASPRAEASEARQLASASCCGLPKDLLAAVQDVSDRMARSPAARRAPAGTPDLIAPLADEVTPGAAPAPQAGGAPRKPPPAWSPSVHGDSRAVELAAQFEALRSPPAALQCSGVGLKRGRLGEAPRSPPLPEFASKRMRIVEAAASATPSPASSSASTRVLSAARWPVAGAQQVPAKNPGIPCAPDVGAAANRPPPAREWRFCPWTRSPCGSGGSRPVAYGHMAPIALPASCPHAVVAGSVATAPPLAELLRTAARGVPLAEWLQTPQTRPSHVLSPPVQQVGPPADVSDMPAQEAVVSVVRSTSSAQSLADRPLFAEYQRLEGEAVGCHRDLVEFRTAVKKYEDAGVPSQAVRMQVVAAARQLDGGCEAWRRDVKFWLGEVIEALDLVEPAE